MDYNKENAKIYLTGKEQQLMWKRKIIKKRAIALLKQNYWRMISVCFLIAILTTAYSVSTTFLNLQIPSSPEPAEAVFTLRIPNSEAVIGAVRNFAENTPLPGLLGGILEDALAILIDLFSSTISTFFTLLRTVNTAVAEGPGFPLVFSAVSVLLAFFYQILVSNNNFGHFTPIFSLNFTQDTILFLNIQPFCADKMRGFYEREPIKAH